MELLSWMWEACSRPSSDQGGTLLGGRHHLQLIFLCHLHFLRNIFFFFFKVTAIFSVTKATALKECQGPGGHRVWPIWASSLPGLPHQSFLLPRETQSRVDESCGSCMASVGGGSPEQCLESTTLSPQEPGTGQKSLSTPRSKHASSSLGQCSSYSHIRVGGSAR